MLSTKKFHARKKSQCFEIEAEILVPSIISINSVDNDTSDINIQLFLFIATVVNLTSRNILITNFIFIFQSGC
jgi:hypothetical protein